MKSIITIISLLILWTVILVQDVQAQSVAGQSAKLNISTEQTLSPSSAYNETIEIKKRVMKAVLTRYNSPLADSVDAFMETCLTNDLNCYLLPSIAGLESTFGKFIKPGSNNPFGWAGGEYMFASWDEGISIVGKGLRTNYVNKGAVTVEDIGVIYSASPTWAERVNYFIDQFENEEKQYRLNSTLHNVEL